MAEKKVKFQGFVAVQFNKQEKKKIKETKLNDKQVVEFFVEAAELGYKVSVSFSDKGEFYTLTLYGNSFLNKNKGYAMSIRHKDLLVCIAGFLYLFDDTGMSEDWSERFDTQGNNDW